MQRRRRFYILCTVALIAGLSMVVLLLLPRIIHHRGLIFLADAQVSAWADCYHDAGGAALYYRLLPPRGYADRPAGQRYPLLISLHGDGCAGTDNVNQFSYIAPFVSAPTFRCDHPCFVLAPQCPANTYWVAKSSYNGNSYRQTAQPTPATRMLLALLPTLLAKYPIDANRLYVIGWSSGGAGVWELITRRPDLFAAAAPLCGRGDPGKASRIARMPIWVFHGAKDRVVGCSCARIMVQALVAQGGAPRYTEYADAGHDAGFRALQDPRLFDWMFRQHR